MFRYNHHLLSIVILMFVVATGLGISYLDHFPPFKDGTSQVTGSNGGSSNNNSHTSSNGTTSTPGPSQSPATSVPFHTIDRSIFGGGNFKPTNLVIDENATWTALWLRLDSNCVNDCPLEPGVNFASRTVIAVILGLKPTAGYNIEVINITQAGQIITLHATITTPDPSPYCVVAQVVTEPYHIVDIPKTTSNVVFDFETVVHHCK